MPNARVEPGGILLVTNLLAVIALLIRHFQGVIMQPHEIGLTCQLFFENTVFC